MTNQHTFICTRRLALAYMAGSLGQLTGCGGSSDVAGLSSGGTGSFSSGTVSGLGSIIVNGVRYNIDNAELRTSTDTLLLPSALQLGMVVAIESSPIIPATSSQSWPAATATRVTCLSGWVGPVASITRTAQQTTFELLGYTVEVLSNTLFSGDAEQFSELTTAHFVEVYGYLNTATGQILASRVDVSTQQPAQYKLTSLFGQIDLKKLSDLLQKSLLNQTLSGLLPPDVVDNLMVQVAIDPNASNANWSIANISKFASQLDTLSTASNYEAEIFGRVTTFTSLSSFTVNGIPVNAQSAQLTGDVSLGKQVKVQGRVDTQVFQIVATQVQEITLAQMAQSSFEFYGEISNITLQTLMVKGETIHHSNSATILALLQTPKISAKVRAYRDGARWQLVDVTIT
jgi:Domain of unknown function (DUF5666)